MDPRLNLIIQAQDRASAQMDKVGNAGTRMGSTLKAAAAVAVAAIATIGVAAAGLAVKAITAASDLEESVNAVNVVFGENSGEILSFAETASQNVGLSEAAFNTLAVSTGALLTNFGSDTATAAEQTTTLAQRAADMASVFNTDVGTALEAINAAIRGETEAIRTFGVDVTDASLGAYLLSQGIDTSVESLTFAEKAQLRVALVMEQTNKVAGDFSNTSGSLANQQRILGARLENLAASLGEKLLPVATAALTWVVDMVTELQDNLEPIIGTIREAFTGTGTDISEKLQPALELLQAAWLGISSVAVNLVWPILTSLADVLLPKIQNVIDTVVLPAIRASKTACGHGPNGSTTTSFQQSWRLLDSFRRT